MATSNRTKAGKGIAALAAGTTVAQGGVLFPYSDDLPDLHKRIWRQTVNCKPVDYFNPGDIPLLEMYCRNVYEWQELNREIDTNGMVVPNARGNPVVNPSLMARGFVEAKILALATKLRLQPASRLNTENDKSQNAKAGKARKAANEIDDDGLLDGADDTPLAPGEHNPIDGYH